jgi:hypothetical protein
MVLLMTSIDDHFQINVLNSSNGNQIGTSFFASQRSPDDVRDIDVVNSRAYLQFKDIDVSFI